VVHTSAPLAPVHDVNATTLASQRPEADPDADAVVGDVESRQARPT
jgi:hypothetical protein